MKPKDKELKELTDKQNGQIDAIHNACYQLVCDLTGQELNWNLEWIGEVADTVEWVVCKHLKLMTEMEFYPYVEED